MLYRTGSMHDAGREVPRTPSKRSSLSFGPISSMPRQPHSAVRSGVGCSGAGNRKSMRRKQTLSRIQQRAVERLAKGQGCTCIECGSADYLVSDTNALLSFGNVNVALFCNNPDAEHPEGVLALGQSFPLSFAQAEAIGLKVPPA